MLTRSMAPAGSASSTARRTHGPAAVPGARSPSGKGRAAGVPVGWSLIGWAGSVAGHRHPGARLLVAGRTATMVRSGRATERDLRKEERDEEREDGGHEADEEGGPELVERGQAAVDE